MDFIEKTGKNVEEALNDALAELKTTADKVNVEVIEEAKNGIFGLFAKKAKIRVTLKDAAKKIGDIVDETVDSIKEDYKAGKQEAAAARENAKKEEAKPAAVCEYVIEEAAVEASKIRFRAIMMTVVAFVVGMIPLVLARGAGASSRISVGSTVFGGMLAAGTLGTIMTPAFYTIIQHFVYKVMKKKTHAEEKQ